MSFLKEFLGKFPSSFTTSISSTNWKLSKFLADGLDQAKDALNQIDKYRNVDNAEGKALDKLGDKYGVKRGPADDEFYRMMIRSKISNRKGDTTVNGILRTMQNALNIDVKCVKIGPAYHDGKQEPLSLRISNVPLSFARSEFEQEFMLRQIESTVAVGIRLQDLQFIVHAGGTFAVGVGTATTYSFNIDDSKDYSHSVQGNASFGANSDGVATVEITDQFDDKFEIKDKTKTGASIGALETYKIE